MVFGCCTCSCSCNYLKQWDLSRAVPRHVRDVKLFHGDILGLATGGDCVFSCGADGSIRWGNWRVRARLRTSEAGDHSCAVHGASRST
jgi:hypothetical protein